MIDTSVGDEDKAGPGQGVRSRQSMVYTEANRQPCARGREERTVEDEVELVRALREVEADLVRDLLALRQQLLGVVLRLLCDWSSYHQGSAFRAVPSPPTKKVKQKKTAEAGRPIR